MIDQRPLARGLTSALGIEHESPQGLVFVAGRLNAHASHDKLTADWFEAAIAG